MAKIVSIENDIVKISEDNGNLIEVKRTDLGFDSKIGDEVSISRGEGATTVVLSTISAPVVSQTEQVPVSSQPTTSQPEQIETVSSVPVSQAEQATEINTTPAVLQSEPTAEVNSTPIVNKEPTPINSGSGKTVSKVTYCILCFFLGFLGVHKFYAGKIGMGILYILTIGLFGIGTIIDFFVGIFKKADANGNIIV